MDLVLKELKLHLREEEYPFFSDEQLTAYYNAFNKDLNLTIYKLCLIKSENDSFELSGLSSESSENYWLRLAQVYRPSRSRIL